MRTKAKAESAALHAGLRKEQMKVESLERALQQKVTHPLPARRGCSVLPLGCPAGAGAALCVLGLESAPRVRGMGSWGMRRDAPRGPQGLLPFQNQEIEELTKICDELIAKLGRAD